MPLRSLRKIMKIKPLCQKNLVIRRKSWRNQQPLKGASWFQSHHHLILYPGITGRTSKSEDFKILTIFMKQLKINLHHQKMIHILYMYLHAHGLVYPYWTSILKPNWIQEQITDQMLIISHFKIEHRFYRLTSWQRSWSSKALGWMKDITTCCGDIEEK